MNGTDWPRVGIVILNRNGLEDTLACLESLAQADYPAPDIVIVDNGSTDDSPTIIRRRYPNTTVLEMHRNLGFTGGNNTGLRYLLERGVEWALLLNNDTEVAPDMLRMLVHAAGAEESIGIAGPTIYFYDAPDTIWSAGGRFDRRTGETHMLGLGRRDGGQSDTDRPRDVDFVTGCALLIKRDVLEQVGLLDDRFYLYYEEAEWCARVRRAGYRIIHVPEARMWHKIPLDGRTSSPMVHYYMTRNRFLFLRLTGARPGAWLRTLFGNVRTLASWTIKPRWRTRWAHRDAMLQAIGDAIFGRWGERIAAR